MAKRILRKNKLSIRCNNKIYKFTHKIFVYNRWEKCAIYSSNPITGNVRVVHGNSVDMNKPAITNTTLDKLKEL